MHMYSINLAVKKDVKNYIVLLHLSEHFVRSYCNKISLNSISKQAYIKTILHEYLEKQIFKL